MAGGVRELDVCSCRLRMCFVYVPCYSVQKYECIPGIYVIARVIRVESVYCVFLPRWSEWRSVRRTSEYSVVDVVERSGSVRKDTWRSRRAREGGLPRPEEVEI